MRLPEMIEPTDPQELYGHKSPGTTATYLDERGEWVVVSLRRTTV